MILVTGVTGRLGHFVMSALLKLQAYTSVLHADTSPLGLAAEHKKTEAYLSASGKNVGYVNLVKPEYKNVLSKRGCQGKRHFCSYEQAADRDRADCWRNEIRGCPG